MTLLYPTIPLGLDQGSLVPAPLPETISFVSCKRVWNDWNEVLKSWTSQSASASARWPMSGVYDVTAKRGRPLQSAQVFLN